MMQYFGGVLSLLLLQTHKVRGYRVPDLLYGLSAYLLAGAAEVEMGRAHVVVFSLFLLSISSIGAAVCRKVRDRDRLVFWPFMFAQIAPVVLLLDLVGVNGPVVLVAYVVALWVGLLKDQMALEEGSSRTLDAQDSTAEILRVVRDMRVDEVGPSIGEVLNHQIPEWIQISTGQKLPFVRYLGTQFAVDDIPLGYVVIQPGLLYGGEFVEH